MARKVGPRVLLSRRTRLGKYSGHSRRMKLGHGFAPGIKRSRKMRTAKGAI